MGLHIITDENATRHDGTQGLITLESDLEGPNAIDELSSVAARNMAIRHAGTMGLADPRINGHYAPFPVDAENKEVTLNDVRPVRAYRAEIPVTRRLV